MIRIRTDPDPKHWLSERNNFIHFCGKNNHFVELTRLLELLFNKYLCSPARSEMRRMYSGADIYTQTIIKLNIPFC